MSEPVVHLASIQGFPVGPGAPLERLGADGSSVRTGSVCGAPKGGPETAHPLIKTGAGAGCQNPHLCFVGRPEDARSYWEEEVE